MITKISDYNGYFKLAKNIHNTVEFQAYIDRFEEIVLRELFQCDYDEFIADLVDGVPQSPKWLDLYNKFYDCDNCNDYFSQGIKDMLLCFVFYNYSRESYIQHTITGTVKVKGSSSESLGSQNSRDFFIYNQHVTTFNAIMRKACHSDYDYDFKLIYKEKITQFY